MQGVIAIGLSGAVHATPRATFLRRVLELLSRGNSWPTGVKGRRRRLLIQIGFAAARVQFVWGTGDGPLASLG